MYYSYVPGVTVVIVCGGGDGVGGGVVLVMVVVDVIVIIVVDDVVVGKLQRADFCLLGCAKQKADGDPCGMHNQFLISDNRSI